MSFTQLHVLRSPCVSIHYPRLLTEYALYCLVRCCTELEMYVSDIGTMNPIMCCMLFVCPLTTSEKKEELFLLLVNSL